MECTTIRARVLAETEVVKTNPYGVIEISDGGYERGYAAGYDNGYATGERAGYTNGYDAGQTQAVDYILGGAW